MRVNSRRLRWKDAYGARDELTATRGKAHEYLGMAIDFRVPGRCAMSQLDCIKKSRNELSEYWKAAYRNTPAPENLFKIDQESNELDEVLKEEYHQVTAKALWLSQRPRPDLQLATGFHCTRVKEPAVQDSKKLMQLLAYIWKARYLPLTIGIDENGELHIHIDGAHAAHVDAKGHSGLFATLGLGAMLNVPKKLGINTTSSTETEVVPAGERLPKCTWFRYFRIEQGEDAKEDVLLQDNKSAILLQKNYPYSAGKGSQHIHARYYFAVHKIKSKELRIAHCPTGKLVAGYSSKPLQGMLLTTHRNTLLGVREEDFKLYKKMYTEVLKKYDLFINEEDLHGI